MIETLPTWTNPEQIAELANQHGAPHYFYSEAHLKAQATEALALGAPFGLTVRYAMKANPHPEVLEIFRESGLSIDASSAAEARRAIEVGFRPDQIMLTTQQLPDDEELSDLVNQGMRFNAGSLHQLDTYGRLFPGTSVSVRINPPVGSGMNNRTTTGGSSSSFGIWHEYIPEVVQTAQKHALQIGQIHTHIGSGTDPVVWAGAVETSLGIVKQFPSATSLNLGGGFKVGRMSDESSADMTTIGEALGHLLKDFAASTGRELQLEIEPGTFLVANAGMLVAEVIDRKDTGKDGYTFLIINSGMNDLLRPSIYGAQHPITVVGRNGSTPQETEAVIVQGHNCESGDMFTPLAGDPDTLSPREIGQAAIGDLVVIGGVGAYGKTMAPELYNLHPGAKERII